MISKVISELGKNQAGMVTVCRKLSTNRPVNTGLLKSDETGWLAARVARRAPGTKLGVGWAVAYKIGDDLSNRSVLLRVTYQSE